MLVQEFEFSLVRPPVTIRRAAGGCVVEWTFGFSCHVISPYGLSGIPDKSRGKIEQFGVIVEIFVSCDHHRNRLWRCTSFDMWWPWHACAISLARRSNVMCPS